MTTPPPKTFIAVPAPGAPGLALLVQKSLRADGGAEFLPGLTYGFTPASAVSLLIGDAGKAYVHDEEAMQLWVEALEAFDAKGDVSAYLQSKLGISKEMFKFPEPTLESAPQAAKFLDLFAGPFRKVLGERFAEKVEQLVAEENARKLADAAAEQAKAEALAKAEAAAKLAAVDPVPTPGAPIVVETTPLVDPEKQVPVKAADTVSSPDVEKPSEDPAPTPPPPGKPSARGRRS